MRKFYLKLQGPSIPPDFNLRSSVTLNRLRKILPLKLFIRGMSSSFESNCHFKTTSKRYYRDVIFISSFSQLIFKFEMSFVLILNLPTDHNNCRNSPTNKSAPSFAVSSSHVYHYPPSIYLLLPSVFSLFLQV